MKNFKKHNRKLRGFTLIELLVTIILIGMLATLTAVLLKNAPRKARDSVRLSDIKEIRQALELYYLDHNAYPNGGFLAGTYDSTSNGDWSDTFKNALLPYTKNLPINPTKTNDSGYFYAYWNPVDNAASPCHERIALFIQPGMEAQDNWDDCELGSYSILIK